MTRETFDRYGPPLFVAAGVGTAFVILSLSRVGPFTAIERNGVAGYVLAVMLPMAVVGSLVWAWSHARGPRAADGPTPAEPVAEALEMSREADLAKSTSGWTQERSLIQYPADAGGQRRYDEDTRLFEAHGYVSQSSDDMPNERLFMVAFVRRDALGNWSPLSRPHDAARSWVGSPEGRPSDMGLNPLNPAQQRSRGSPSGPAVAIIGVVGISIALLILGSSPPKETASPGTATTPTATFHATAAPLKATPSPSAPLTEAEASLLASMTARYDDCRRSRPPFGTLVADIRCMTVDGFTVDGAQYTTVAVVADIFGQKAGGESGTRCSAGAHLGDYKVGGKPTGQLGCSGTNGTVAWTVPSLRLYMSASGLSMPEMYAWWKQHWTVGSVARAATTGEKAVPIPVAAADTPEPAAPPDPTEAPLPELAGITDMDVLVAGDDAGLDCQVDEFGITCRGTTSLGTELSLSSITFGDGVQGVQEVVISSFGEAADGEVFLTKMIRALLGSRASSVVAWVGANVDSSVADKTFGPYYVTYRGPLDMADLLIQPPQ